MYSPIPYCAWSLENNKCLQCMEGYALNSQWMGKPYNTEVTCNVAGCAFCLESDMCMECASGFAEINDGGEITC